ncbi:MAG: protease modulator HflK [Novosphingobium sp.]|nr:protease modulator HflK [Novosphingobium sp.]
MAGGRSPWGGGNKGGDDPDSGPDQPKGEDPDESNPSPGPRNPWVPPGDGPPRRSANIEDIFRGRDRRGGGGGGGGMPRMPELPGGRKWFPLIIGAILVLGLVFSSVHLISPQERAVVKTLGNYTRTLNSGLAFSAPWPIETVDVVDVQGVRAVRIPASGQKAKLILTGDQNLVDLSYIVRWNIKNLEQYKFRLAEPIETVNEAAEAAMRASVAEKTLDETFSGQGRAEIEQRVRERMQKTLDAYRAGIDVLGVEIAKADPPAEVVDAFRDVSVAEQNADAAVNQARGYAQQILAQAEGESEAFDKVYEQYKLAPKVTRQRLYYETMERVLSQTDTTIIEAQGVTPYLPLPELRRRAKAQPSTTVTAPKEH